MTQSTYKVLEAVARIFDVPAENLTARTRLAVYAYPRFVAWYILHRRGMSFPKIGAEFGYHHTPVLHGAHRVQADMECVSPWGVRASRAVRASENV